nr:hydroxymethylbilane synthase [Beutenbergia cavernae]
MTSTRTLRVGTRASALATTQSEWAGEAIAARVAAATGSDVEVELVRVTTTGDVLTGSLASMGGTGVFVTALREALLDGRCDVAVHSLKDLPTAAAPGLVLGAVPQREDPRDVLCARAGAGLADLPAGGRVGTGSPRRAAQLRRARPDLEIVDIRGNVDTRLSRISPGKGDLDAVVLARAGLARLGRLDAVTEALDAGVMVPAPGQGALAVEAVDAAPDWLLAGLRAFDDAPTRLAVTAERAMLARLEVGCSAPVGALATLAGSQLLLRTSVGEDAEDLGGSFRVGLPDDDDARLDAAAGLGRAAAEAALARIEAGGPPS